MNATDIAAAVIAADVVERLPAIVIAERTRRHICQKGAARQMRLGVDTLARLERGGPASARTLTAVLAWLTNDPMAARRAA